MLMICKLMLTPDVIVRDQAWNCCVFNCFWRRMLWTLCCSSATSLSEAYYFLSNKLYMKSIGKYQIITASMVIDYVYLYIYIRFDLGFLYHVCTQNFPFFSWSFSCFSFNFKEKPKN